MSKRKQSFPFMRSVSHPAEKKALDAFCVFLQSWVGLDGKPVVPEPDRRKAHDALNWAVHHYLHTKTEIRKVA